jgi:hypothetical protein
VTVTLDTTGPALDWKPADRSGFFAADLVVSGTATDAYAGVAEVLVNGSPASLTADGRFAADVRLAEGENTITVTARDRLGNETTESRKVAFFAYTTRWHVAGAQGQGELHAFLDVTTAADASVQADSVNTELVEADGDVAASAEMRYGDGRYKANLGRPAAGEYTLRGLLSVSGWTVRLTGPAVVRAEERSRSGASP